MSKKIPVKELEISEPLSDIIRSVAFSNLSNASRVALILILNQRRSVDQKEVKFPYHDAIIYMHRTTFAGTIRYLEQAGFLIKNQIGGTYRKTNVYVFTDKWRDLGYITDAKTMSWKDRYHAYLKTPEWKTIAARKIKQARGRCQLCNGSEFLSVHHRTYERIFKEQLTDLIVLCNECHKKHHGINMLPTN